MEVDNEHATGYNVPVMEQAKQSPTFAFTIAIDRMKWVAKAVSTDAHRRVLTFAEFAPEEVTQ